MRAFARSFSLAVLLALGALPLRAQRPAGSDSLSPKAIADSLQVLDELTKKVLKEAKGDAPTWYRLGMIAWALAERADAGNAPRGLNAIKLRATADSSLKIAVQLDPEKPYYRLAVGRFLLRSTLPSARVSAAPFFEQALEVARRKGDSLQIAEAAIEVGRVRWRKFDALENRRIETNPGAAIRSIHNSMQPANNGTDTDVGMMDMKVVRDALERGTFALPPEVTGESDYTKATELFKLAYQANPSNARAVRSLAMLLADKENWTELQAFSRAHTTASPWDPWGWLALGLAEHRLGNARAASTAFSNALTNMAPQERARLDRLARLRPRNDSSVVTRGTEAQRAQTAGLYWQFADPMWSRMGNESRIEFWARLAYAELRWTVDELHVHGADTDRGDVYVRYGPPDIVAAVGPDPSQGVGEVSWVWVYRSGLMFAFNGTAGFATARTPTSDLSATEALIQNQPVRWDNLASMRVDSMPTQIARFRAAGDSVDLYLAAQPPVDSIRKYSDVGAVKSFVYFLNAAGQKLFEDSTVIATKKGSSAWTRRVAPSTYVYRVETSTESSTRGGRATIIFPAVDTSFTLKGPGLSDLLFATNAAPKSGRATKRWSDLDIAPTAGAVERSGQLALVWEAYELGAKDGNASYQVSITLQRNRSAAGKFAASIVGALAGVANIATQDDRISITFDRAVPHAPALADHIEIALGETPRGNYTATLQLTDRVTGKVLTRTRSFIIRD
jgi:GWxTD domain-containing protein